jgi:hypothetical protein
MSFVCVRRLFFKFVKFIDKFLKFMNILGFRIILNDLAIITICLL